jgi:hypothetical protein
MSDPAHDETLPDTTEHGEVVEPRPAAAALEPARRPVAALPAVQAAAAVAAGFVAGAAVVGLVGHRRRRTALEGGRRSLLRRRASVRNPTALERLQIVGSRSLLLDVHLLGGPGTGR